jgi:hypothetical protein
MFRITSVGDLEALHGVPDGASPVNRVGGIAYDRE